MTASPGAVGMLWLWAMVADLGSGAEPEHPADAAAEDTCGA
jgi:hypothetical protein